MAGENYIITKEEFGRFQKNKLIERPILALKVKAENGVKTPLFFLNPIPRVYMPLGDVSSYPALLIKKYIKGKIIYSPSLLEAFYGEYRIKSSSYLINQIVEMLSPKKIIEVKAPPTVEVEIYYQKDSSRYIIHLINGSGDMERPISNFIPVFEIKIKINKKDVKRVFNLRDKRKLEKINDFYVLPKLIDYDIIVIELK